MLGMHGTVFANFAVDEADLLLAFGVRFDDRVTGKLETFAAKAKIVHIDIDPAEISKNKEAHVMVCSDIRPALRGETCSAENSSVNKAGMQDLVHLAPCSKASSISCSSNGTDVHLADTFCTLMIPQFFSDSLRQMCSDCLSSKDATRHQVIAWHADLQCM